MTGSEGRRGRPARVGGTRAVRLHFTGDRALVGSFPMGYGVIGSPTGSGPVSLGSSPGTPAEIVVRRIIRPPGASWCPAQSFVAGAGLGEDRLQMILDRVLGQRHLAGHGMRVAAGGEQAEQLVLAGGEAEGAGEQIKAVGRGDLLDGDDDGRRAGVSLGWPSACRWRWPCARRKPW